MTEISTSFQQLNIKGNPSELRIKIERDTLCPKLKSGIGGLLPLRNSTTSIACHDKNSLKEWENDPQSEFERILKFITIGYFGMKFYIDKSRRAFISEFSYLARTLDFGRLSGNGSCRLVVGPKGTGKSTLLQALVIAVQMLATSTIAIYVDASKVAEFKSPLQVISDGIKGLLPKETNLPDFDAAVEAGDVGEALDIINAMGLRILLVIDEYHTVYSLSRELGGIWTLQIYKLGLRDVHGHLVILSGSAPYMRSLCFGHSPPNNPMFPSYMGKYQNLNSGRFQVRAIHPISDENDLKEYLATLKLEPPIKKLLNRKEVLNWIYVTSGGIYRLIDPAIQQLLATRQVISVSASYEQGHLYKVNGNIDNYEGLYAAMIAAMTSEGQTTDDPWLFTQWTNWPVQIIMEKKDRYNAVDAGAILLEETSVSDRVRFAIPLQALLTIERGLCKSECPVWFDAYARLCLRYPYGTLGIDAEAVLRKSIMSTSWDIDLSEVGVYDKSHSVVDYTLHVDSTGSQHVTYDDQRGNEQTVQVDNSKILNTPMREVPDRRGADIVILKRDSDGNQIMYRIQVKLGTGTFGSSAAKEAVTKLIRGKGNLVQKCRLFIVTTRRCTAGAKNACLTHDITLIEPAQLATAWAPCVRAWAQSERLTQYLIVDRDHVGEDFDDDDDDDDEDDDEEDDDHDR